jgi:hypothetical protein
MAPAVKGDFQEAGRVERFPDRVVARTPAEVKAAGRGVKKQADRGQGAVLQALQARL